MFHWLCGYAPVQSQLLVYRARKKMANNLGFDAAGNELPVGALSHPSGSSGTSPGGSILNALSGRRNSDERFSPIRRATQRGWRPLVSKTAGFDSTPTDNLTEDVLRDIYDADVEYKINNIIHIFSLLDAYYSSSPLWSFSGLCILISDWKFSNISEIEYSIVLIVIRSSTIAKMMCINC